ncbi:MAG: glycosyltransferase family 4 protein [Candidatus Euphemobacter frigidus]|nr:glycosyltransferase family 4 protein [Candidatus Euphemobacter frigidus]MDP8275389.1 glycosyltransferase family 4 protein [Candidatus Euphemobacter frigidus]
MLNQGLTRETPGVHQLVPVIEEEDAIGNYALTLRNFLREKGFDSRIFVYETRPGQEAEVFSYREHRRFSRPDNVLIFHTAIGSPLADYFIGCPDRKLLIHHNITPARFFTPWDREIAYLAHQARRGLSRMAGVVSSALADSPFNARELLELGYPEPEVIPLIFDWDRLNGPSDESVIQRYRDGRTNLLFVGRVAPNKKQEDILSAFHYYQNYFNQNSRLILVGEDRRFPVYTRALLKRSRDLKLSEVVFTGKVSREALRSFYRVSSLFLCLSEHEGLGVPLVESLFYRLPVVAFEAGAVGFTLGSAGILLREKRSFEIASLIHRILTDRDLRDKILGAQDRRLEYFQQFPYREKWGQVIRRLLPPAPGPSGEALHQEIPL